FDFIVSILYLPSFPTRRSSDLVHGALIGAGRVRAREDQDPTCEHHLPDHHRRNAPAPAGDGRARVHHVVEAAPHGHAPAADSPEDRKSTRLNSSHVKISYAVFC